MPRRRAEPRGAYVTPPDRTISSLGPPPPGPAAVTFKRPEPGQPSAEPRQAFTSQGPIDMQALAIEALADAVFKRMQDWFVPQPRPGQELTPRVTALQNKINGWRQWATGRQPEVQADWEPFLVLTELFVRIVEAAISRNPVPGG